MPAYDVDAVRRAFPSLALEVGGRPAAFLDGRFDRCEVVVRQHHVGRLLGDVRTRDAHGDADVRALERRIIIFIHIVNADDLMPLMEQSLCCMKADKAGRAGYVDSLPREHFNQPHHPGGAMVIAPNGDILKHTQTERIRDEMIVVVASASPLFNDLPDTATEREYLTSFRRAFLVRPQSGGGQRVVGAVAAPLKTEAKN